MAENININRQIDQIIARNERGDAIMRRQRVCDQIMIAHQPDSPVFSAFQERLGVRLFGITDAQIVKACRVEVADLGEGRAR